MTHPPVIIVGAPRSGTNMLRDALVNLPGVATWPCDEINAIWCYGNGKYATDELPADAARSDVVKYIHGRFAAIAKRYNAQVVVEKTCANCLRIEFVDRVFPDARYVYIRRDGLDAAASAMKRWAAPVDVQYTLRKARFIPLRDAAKHAFRFITNRLQHAAGQADHLKSWGPRFQGIDELARTAPVEEVCATQWRRCVDAAESSLSMISQERVVSTTYEAFVADPALELRRILDALKLEARPHEVEAAVQSVRSDSVGRGRAELRPEVAARIEAIVNG